jgi:CheY-like chemotaxis protein
VVISDIEMPGGNGYAFIRQLRERELATGRRVPAIALTAYARAEDRIRALEAGFPRPHRARRRRTSSPPSR